MRVRKFAWMRTSLLAACLGLCLSSVAKADLIFSNLGPGGTYATQAQGVAWAVEGASVGVIQTAIAASFTPTTTAVLSDIQLAVFYFGSGLTNPITNSSIVIELQNNNSGAPGSVIESWTASNLPVYNPSSGSQPLTFVSSTLSLTLSAGTQYWVSVLPGNSDTDAGWAVNSLGLMGVSSSNDGGSTWSPVTNAPPIYTPAFQVDSVASAVAPEPSNLFLAGTGIAGMVGYAWRRRKQAVA
jgi:PEP-CTERM motif